MPTRNRRDCHDGVAGLARRGTADEGHNVSTMTMMGVCSPSWLWLPVSLVASHSANTCDHAQFILLGHRCRTGLGIISGIRRNNGG